MNTPRQDLQVQNNQLQNASEPGLPGLPDPASSSGAIAPQQPPPHRPLAARVQRATRPFRRRNAIAWLVGAVLLSAFIIQRMHAHQIESAAAQAALALAASAADLDITPADYTVLRQRTLERTLPISGTLKAINSAQVKARVAGELQDLTVREGDTVQAGQIIARIEPLEYAARFRQARMQADASKAQFDIAQRQYDNNAALVQQGFISATALDTSLAQLNAARAPYQAAVAASDVAQKSASDTVLRAPMSGQISQRLAQPGEHVPVDARIVEIVDLNRMEIEVAMSAADSISVRVGQLARLQVEGITEPVPAKVVRINPSAQEGSRSVLVYLQFDSGEGLNKLNLRQGLFAQGEIATDTYRAVVVPMSVVRNDKPQPYIQVLDGDTVRHIPVKLGERGRERGVTPAMRDDGSIDPNASDEGEIALATAADGRTLEGRAALQGVVGPLREGTKVHYVNDVSDAAAK
jgi:RND family efflux transporter MFP subunit